MKKEDVAEGLCGMKDVAEGGGMEAERVAFALNCVFGVSLLASVFFF